MTDLAAVAVLYARKDSVYKIYPWADVWDAERDARKWPGGAPVVAHPPCRAWGRLRGFAKPRPDEKALAIHAVAQVRQWGGVLEHPKASTLFDELGLPKPGNPVDDWGGYTIEVEQVHWGHKAVKPTWLYIVGCYALPRMPTFKVATAAIRAKPGQRSVTKTEREATPEPFARWLMTIAMRSRPRRRA